MPNMDGFELGERIMRMLDECKITKAGRPYMIAASGHMENQYISEAMKSGFNNYMTKPIESADFELALLAQGF
jgi:CheY-like chemotaxis protein